MEGIRPQAGAQERFLASSADIAIYGGAAGGGKSFGLLMEPLRHINNKEFGGVIFRRTSPQITNEGALWDEAGKLYPLVNGDPRDGSLEYHFPSGAAISFRHLQHEATKYDWQGAQIPFIGFDELTHFTKSQFFYLLSRNRSTCGVRPYIRATCNPDADSWVAEFIAWWIDQETGLPIPERAAKVRWFVRVGDAMIWADKPEQLGHHTMVDETGKTVPIPPKSVTFIPAKLSDNPALVAADPGYLANLMALPFVERERLLGGNWKIRPAAGLYFKRHWCQVVDAAPAGVRWVRYWDLAATEKTEGNDPDWTEGAKLGRDPVTKLYYLADLRRMRESPKKVEEAIKNTASDDGNSVEIGIPQDPAQAGKAQAAYLVTQLSGYTARARIESGDKITRFGPFSAQCEAGNVKILRGPWNTTLCDNLEAFPEAAHDDTADACSGAFSMLQTGTSSVAPLRM
jgi:predicted phage terminase large subunit-like protein